MDVYLSVDSGVSFAPQGTVEAGQSKVIEDLTEDTSYLIRVVLEGGDVDTDFLVEETLVNNDATFDRTLDITEN